MTEPSGPAIDSTSRRLARALYSTLVRLAVPLVALRVLWRGRREPLYAHHLGERFGFYRGAADPGALWIHAVSLGETRAASSLALALRAAIPGVRLLLTHGTATGRSAGAELLREGEAQAWLPFDTPGAMRRFHRHFRPRVGVLVETETWPNVVTVSYSLGVPVVLANARLSERSRQGNRRIDALLRPAFEKLSAVLAQSEADAARLRDAGAREVEVVGNLKFDQTPDPALLERGSAWKRRVGRAVVLAAVTREGEEGPLLEAWRGLQAPRPLLVVVPRHPQRFDAVADLIAVAGFSVSRRSAWSDGPPEEASHADVWLGDSMMEMPAWYALADVALLGGSFAPLGGQNLIEAAACGCPVVMGPHTFNFAEAAALSLAAGASVRVESLPAAVDAAVAMLAVEERARRAHAALAFAAAHRGAAERSARRIAAIVRARSA